MLFVETTADPSSFMENDKVIITLPFPASRINRDKTSIKNDAWEVEYSGNTLCCTCKKSSYKDEEHLIVIPGGGKYADPKIPWYGPEYLIGKFPATVEYE